MLLSLLWHAATHKRCILDHECGACIVFCTPRFWFASSGSVVFIPWPGAFPEKIESAGQLTERIESHHAMLGSSR